MSQAELSKKLLGLNVEPAQTPAPPSANELEELARDPARLFGLKDAMLSGWFQNDGDEVFKGMPIGPSDVVVDVGCGDGGALNFCAKRGAHVIAVDIDAENIENTRRRLQDSGARQVDCHVSDANPLPLADASVTRVICTEVLEHVDDPEQLLRELFRVGKPGALYLLSVPDALGEELQKLVAPPNYFQKPNHVRIIGRDEFERFVRAANLEMLEHEYVGFFWALWWGMFWIADVDLSDPRHPILDNWMRTWQAVLDDPRGLELKRKLDRFMPKSQVIIARKP